MIEQSSTSQTPAEEPDRHPQGWQWIFKKLEEVYEQGLHSGMLDICLQSLQQYVDHFKPYNETVKDFKATFMKEMKDNG